MEQYGFLPWLERTPSTPPSPILIWAKSLPVTLGEEKLREREQRQPLSLYKLTGGFMY